MVGCRIVWFDGEAGTISITSGPASPLPPEVGLGPGAPSPSGPPPGE